MFGLNTWRWLHPDGAAGSPPPEGTPPPDEEQGEPGGEKGKGTSGDGDGAQEMPVTMTQSALDELINKAFARGARKGKKDAQPPPDKPAGEAGNDSAAKAEAMMETAKNTLLEGAVLALAGGVELSSKGAEAAMLIAKPQMLACIDEDGKLNKEALKDELETFLKEWPQFKAQKEQQENPPPPYAAGTGGQPIHGGKNAGFAFQFTGVRPKPDK